MDHIYTSCLLSCVSVLSYYYLLFSFCLLKTESDRDKWLVWRLFPDVIFKLWFYGLLTSNFSHHRWAIFTFHVSHHVYRLHYIIIYCLFFLSLIMFIGLLFIISLLMFMFLLFLSLLYFIFPYSKLFVMWPLKGSDSQVNGSLTDEYRVPPHYKMDISPHSCSQGVRYDVIRILRN